VTNQHHDQQFLIGSMRTSSELTPDSFRQLQTDSAIAHTRFL